MNPLTPEEIDLVETIAESLGFHQREVVRGIRPQRTVLLADSHNGHDLAERRAALENAISLMNMDLKARIAAHPTFHVTYSICKP